MNARKNGKRRLLNAMISDSQISFQVRLNGKYYQKYFGYPGEISSVGFHLFNYPLSQFPLYISFDEVVWETLKRVEE